MKLPEYHATLSFGTTCNDPDFQVIELGDPSGLLERIRARCELSAASARVDVREKGRAGLALLAAVDAGEKGAELAIGRFWQEWRDKDATEEAFRRGLAVAAAGVHGKKGGRPPIKRESAERWLRDHETEVRRRAAKCSREGLAAWVRLEMEKVRPRPSQTVVKRALRSFLQTPK